MYSPNNKQLPNTEPSSKVLRSGSQIYKEVCQELGKTPSNAVNSSMSDNAIMLKTDSLMEQEMSSLKLLFDRHHFQKIVLYKETSELGDTFDSKTASFKPKLFTKSPQFSQKSFSRVSNGKSSKSPQAEQKKGKGNKANENIPLFCKILVNQLIHTNSLEVLNFCGMKLGNQALAHLAMGIKDNHSLRELSITYCELTSQDFEQLYGAIGENNNLYLLDLSHNHLDDEAGRMIGSIISIHGRKRDEMLWVYSIRGDQPDEDPELKGICDINISNNQIGSRGLKEMCGPLRYDTWLRNLNLRGNQIGEDAVTELRQVLAHNNSLFAIDLRENPFFNQKLSKEIVAKLATNIRNYKEKNMTPLTEESSQNQLDEEMPIEEANELQTSEPQITQITQINADSGHTFQGWNSEMKLSGTFNIQPGEQGEPLETEKTANPVINEEIEKLIRKYEIGSDEETKEDQSNKKHEGVSFGFRNEKIKEKLRKEYKKQQKKKNTRSEGRAHTLNDKGHGPGTGCKNCRNLEKKLLKSESRSVNLLLENYKLRKKLNAILQAQNSWSAISPQFNEIENTSHIPHPENSSQDLFKKNMTLADQAIPEPDEMFNRIENLMAELTRMMDNLENGNATNNFTDHFTNSTHLTNNNTYQLINSANNINFNSTTNILNSNNNSRIHALANPNLQQTISFHQANHISQSLSRSQHLKFAQHLHSISEQNALTPGDKSENLESKAVSQFSLFFQNENSQINQSHHS